MNVVLPLPTQGQHGSQRLRALSHKTAPPQSLAASGGPQAPHTSAWPTSKSGFPMDSPQVCRLIKTTLRIQGSPVLGIAGSFSRAQMSNPVKVRGAVGSGCEQIGHASPGCHPPSSWGYPPLGGPPESRCPWCCSGFVMAPRSTSRWPLMVGSPFPLPSLEVRAEAESSSLRSCGWFSWPASSILPVQPPPLPVTSLARQGHSCHSGDCKASGKFWAGNQGRGQMYVCLCSVLR